MPQTLTLPRFNKMLPWLMLLAGVLLTQYLYHVSLTTAEQLLQEKFAYQTRDIAQRIELRMAAYEQVLRGVDGLFAASQTVERDEFYNYISGLDLDEHYPGIQAIGYSQLIPAQEKNRHIAAIRQQGFPEYTIHPAGERDYYTSLIYIEPFKGQNLRAFGFDLHTDAVRRKAADQARDLDKATISDKVRLVQESSEHAQAGLLMFLPVYRNGVPHLSLQERRANILGWVYAAFRMDDLMLGVLGVYNPELDIKIFDGKGATTTDALMHDDDDGPWQGRHFDSSYNATLPLSIAGHPWTLAVRSLPPFEAHLDTDRSYAIQISGILLSLLLALLVWLLHKGHASAVRVVADITQELTDRENRFRKVFEGNNSIAYLLNPRDGHIEDANPTAASFWGYDRATLQHMNIAQIILAPSENILQSIAHILEGGESRQEWRQQLHDGEIRDVEVVSGVITYKGETVLYCIAHDITNRKQAEFALSAESHKNQMLLRTASDGIHILDADGNVLQASNAFCRMLGYSLDEVLSLNVAQWDAQWSPEDLKERIDSIMASGKSAFFETKHRRKDGSMLDVEISAIGVRIDGKSMLYASARDITQRKLDEKALRESEALNTGVLSSLSEHIAVLDSKGCIIAVNEAWRQFALSHGASAMVGDCIGLNYLEKCAVAIDSPFSKEAHAAQAGIESVLDGSQKVFHLEYPCHSTYETRWFHMRVSPLQWPRAGVVVAHEDITERREREDALRLAATVFETVDEGVVVSDTNNIIMMVNPAFSTITGFSPEEIVGKNLRVLRTGAQPEKFYKDLWDTLTETGSWSGEITNRRKDGTPYTEWLSIKMVQDDSGYISHYVGVFSDITARKATEEHVQHLAHYDMLTDLPNRSLLTDRLHQALAQARREKSMLAVMFLDLDKFKPVNDALGHDIGDLLLKDVATRLESCIQRESDTVSRIGGDEFVILLPHIEDENEAIIMAKKVLHSLNQPFDINDNKIEISSSIGIAIYPEHGIEAKQLMKNADTAMYHAKESGRNGYQIFNEHMQETVPQS